ncbi:hypothetical protein J5N97_019795 [Dioscorea zingiberensis]|uniref:Uncharacterized protein n=1 Tax=Dioscorea zingiberensis TaxID=325984 RepID=A0A9D5HCM2_9LILI|nr:hypothetical protein J5N97_019795 [Dioscorea zingiberensis]
MSKSKKKNVTLMDGILASKFEGLSGYVEFGNDGSRRLENNSLAFRVINFVGKSYREMGFWSDGVGLCKQNDVSVDVLQPVYWPGGSIKAPGGWRKLRVAVQGDRVFSGRFVKVDYDDDDFNGKLRSFKGFCIDAFKESLKKLKYDVDFEFLPSYGTYEDLIHEIALKRFDIAVGDITILASRVRLVDFTLPYTESSLGMLVQTQPNGNAWIFLKPFSKEVLGLIALSFIYTTLIVWHLEKERNSNFAGTWRSQFGTALWLMFSTIFFPLKKVRNYYTKFILVVWLFVVLIITQTFTASLSSILTAEKLKPVLDISEVGVNSDSHYLIKYLEDVHHLQAQRIQQIEDYHKAFQSGKINAAFMETPYLRLFLSLYQDYTIYGETEKLGGFGFAFPKGSPLVADFNVAILQLLEDGILKDLEKKWFSVIISNCPTTENYRNTGNITIDNLWGLFLLTGGTTTLVFLFSIAHSIRAQCQWFVAKGRVSLIRIWRSSSVSNNLETMKDQVHALEAQEGSSVVARSVHGQGNGHA